MAKVNWYTSLKGQLQVKIRGVGNFGVELVKDNLAVYFAQAYAVLTSKFLYGVEVERDWEIESFSPKERILVIVKKGNKK